MSVVPLPIARNYRALACEALAQVASLSNLEERVILHKVAMLYIRLAIIEERTAELPPVAKAQRSAS